MKRIFKTIIVLAFLTTNSLFSQDIIELNNGDDIKVKVTEILKNEVKYKKFTNIEGPTYSIEKRKVLMIRYANGEKDIFKEKKEIIFNNQKLDMSAGYFQGTKKLTKKEFKKILFKNPKAKAEYKSGKLFFTLGVITEIIGMGVLVGGITTEEKDLVLPGALTFAGGFGISMIGGSMVKKSVKTYNSGENISYEFKINTNGVGFVMNF